MVADDARLEAMKVVSDYIDFPIPVLLYLITYMLI